MTIVRLPMLLAVLGIAALLASACGEGGSAEPAKTLEVALPNGAALPPTVIPSPTPCPPEGCPTLSEVKKLTASDAQAGDHFGSSVVVSGDTVAVGASFAVYLFQRDEGGPGNWAEVTKLIATDAQADHEFGTSVAISRDTVLVGASQKFYVAGAAYVFQRNEGGANNWGQVSRLTASDAQAGDGPVRVAISGGTVVIGAHGEDAGGNFAGAAYIFEHE